MPRRRRCTCTPADNGGRPLPKDRIAMLHRPGCPFVVDEWREYHRRIAAGEPSDEIIHSMAARLKGKTS